MPDDRGRKPREERPRDAGCVDFRALFETAPEPSLVLDADLRVVAVTDAYLRAFGGSRESVVGRPAREVLPGDAAEVDELDRALVRTYESPDAAPALVGRRLFCSTTPVRDADGRVRWVRLRVVSAEYLPTFPAGRPPAEGAAALERDTLRALIENIPVGIALADARGVPFSLNAEALRIHGVDPEVGQERPFVQYADRFEVRTPDGQLVPFGDWPAARAARGVFDRDRDLLVVVRDTGDVRFVRFNALPVRDASGATAVVGYTLVDLTKVKHDERVLRESEERFRKIFENCATGIAVCEGGGRFLECNPAFCGLLGYDCAELHSLNSIALVHPDDLAANVAEVTRLRAGEIDSFEIEHRCVHKEGHPVWVRRFVSTLGHDHPVPHLVALVTDVTERRRAEQALRDQEERLRAILNTATDAIVTIDDRGVVQSANPATERMFGYAADEVVGRNISLLMPSPYRETHDDYLDRYLRTGEPHVIGGRREAEARHKDGTIFAVDVAVSRIDYLGLFTGIIRDVRRRKELEREIVEIAAMEQKRIGQDLHDQCGQELTAMGLLIDGLVDSIGRPASTAMPVAIKLQQALRRVLRNVRSISRGLVPRDVPADGLAGAIAELAERLTETSGLPVACRVDGPVDLGDPARATQLYHIAQEACTNALRHAQAGRVEIRLRRDGRAVVLEVQDDGVGIACDAAEGLGRRIMRNRANIAGAALSIGPAYTRGTLVRCTLALEGGRP